MSVCSCPPSFVYINNPVESAEGVYSEIWNKFALTTNPNPNREGLHICITRGGGELGRGCGSFLGTERRCLGLQTFPSVSFIDAAV